VRKQGERKVKPVRYGILASDKHRYTEAEITELLEVRKRSAGATLSKLLTQEDLDKLFVDARAKSTVESKVVSKPEPQPQPDNASQALLQPQPETHPESKPVRRSRSKSKSKTKSKSEAQPGEASDTPSKAKG